MDEDFDVDKWRKDMQRQIRMLWWFFAAVTVFVDIALPWKLGWSGVGTAVWITCCCLYARFFPMFVFWMRRRMSEPMDSPPESG